MIPLVVGVFYLPEAWVPMHAKNLTAAVFFIIAAVTDWLDGFRRGAGTRLRPSAPSSIRSPTS